MTFCSDLYFALQKELFVSTQNPQNSCVLVSHLVWEQWYLKISQTSGIIK